MTFAILLAALALGPSAPSADPIVGFWQGQAPGVRGTYPVIQVTGPNGDGEFWGLTMGPNPIYFDTCGHASGEVVWVLKRTGGGYAGTHWGFANTQTCAINDREKEPAAWALSGNRMDVRVGETGGTAGTCGSAGTACFTFVRVAGPNPPAAKDTAPPTVTALASTGKRGGTTTLRFRAKDDSGTTKLAIEIRRGGRVVGTLNTKFGAAKGDASAVRFPTPAGFSGTYTWCAVAQDKAGNRSTRSCASLKIA